MRFGLVATSSGGGRFGCILLTFLAVRIAGLPCETFITLPSLPFRVEFNPGKRARGAASEPGTPAATASAGAPTTPCTATTASGFHRRCGDQLGLAVPGLDWGQWLSVCGCAVAA